MEGNTIQLRSIWGKWWEPIRKWFYPAWLLYETTIRFYDYAISTHRYFITQQNTFGEAGAQALSILGSIGTFLVCFGFLTIPGCIALFKFFKSGKVDRTSFEENIKKYF